MDKKEESNLAFYVDSILKYSQKTFWRILKSNAKIMLGGLISNDRKIGGQGSSHPSDMWWQIWKKAICWNIFSLFYCQLTMTEVGSDDMATKVEPS